MDDTTLRVYSVLFVIITIVLVYTARFFHSRRSRRVTEQQLIGFEHMPAWVGQAIDTSRPLHLSFGSAAVGSDGTPVALAEAEFFYQIIQATASSDSAPLISAASAATIPLAQDTVRRAWQGGDQLKRVRWYPQRRSFHRFCGGSLGLDAGRRTARAYSGRQFWSGAGFDS